MALTPEQQAQVDIADAIEATRHQSQMAMQRKQAKLEAVRLAKEVLLENARSKSLDARDVAAADIATFAETLVAYIDA
jgi:DNA-binding ferritin-like protein (Dps family)